MVKRTPATWIDWDILPRRTSHMIANVSECQHNSSLQQLIYIRPLLQTRNIQKQICSSVQQLYRRIGNKRALKENEDQQEENCFAGRKLECVGNGFTVSLRRGIHDPGGRLLFYPTLITRFYRWGIVSYNLIQFLTSEMRNVWVSIHILAQKKYGSRDTRNAGRSDKVAQPGKALAVSKPDDPSLILGIQIVEKEN